jgi:hypothetical protein
LTLLGQRAFQRFTQLPRLGHFLVAERGNALVGLFEGAAEVRADLPLVNDGRLGPRLRLGDANVRVKACIDARAGRRGLRFVGRDA